MDGRPLIFLDIETTGLDPKAARITEIGAIRVEHNEITAQYQQLIDPGVPISYFITRLTGIDDAMVSNQPSFADIADELLSFLDGCVFAAHNVSFDFSFIQAECARIGIDFDTDRFCTRDLSKKLYPTQRRHNLDTILATHGIQVKNRHRALDDAIALYDFYISCSRQHGDSLVTAIEQLFTRRLSTTY